MAVSEQDRWRVAQQLISTYGGLAEHQARVLAARLLSDGNPEGFSLWQDIALRVHQLQLGKSPGMPLH